MDKLQDIYNNIKERFSNPLIFSYIYSWLIINWKITVSLLWFDASQIRDEGYKSILDLINSNLTTRSSFWYPLFCAVIYTLFSPLIRNLVRALYSWMSKWGNSWNLRILDGGQISINKYLNLREEYDKRTSLLQNVISQEESYKQNFEIINTELLSTKASLNETSQRLIEAETKLNAMRNPRILDGHWHLTYNTDIIQGTERLYINDGKYYIINSNGEKEHTFDVTNFLYDMSTNDISFVKELVLAQKAKRDKSEHFSFNQLRLENADLLKGTENSFTRVLYRRIPIFTLEE